MKPSTDDNVKWKYGIVAGESIHGLRSAFTQKLDKSLLLSETLFIPKPHAMKTLARRLLYLVYKCLGWETRHRRPSPKLTRSTFGQRGLDLYLPSIVLTPTKSRGSQVALTDGLAAYLCNAYAASTAF
jgi:hypothetical protein